jgi:UDP-GlcNAc:undecaprenyl-phosphate GlcNAc-1-phosphate transferase
MTTALLVLSSFAVVLAFTPAVRALACRWGMVARPKADRWHSWPTALLGGVAIAGPVLAVELLGVAQSAQSRAVLGASAWLFLVGLLDDLINLKPYQKLAGQILAASAVIAFGLTLPWTGSPPLNAAITLFWLVGITNALNLLDNMDGLAAGIATVACGSLALHFHAIDQPDLVAMMLVLAAALLGFLVYNTNPASIFMGDCGSLFIGSFLAGSALLDPAAGRTRTFLPVLAVPVLTLCIPIFDMLLVAVLRKLAGRPVSRGGRDHTSHRLVALGLSERSAVLLLCGLATLSGLLALAVHDLPLDVGLAAIAGFTVVLAVLGVHLARVQVYEEDEVDSARRRPMVAFLFELSYKRRIFEVLLDVILVALSYYLAGLIVFGPVVDHTNWDGFLPVLAAIVGIKLVAFLAMGVYRGVWRYFSLPNVVLYARAVFAGSVLCAVTILFFNRFEGLSRAVFALDGLLLLAMLIGSRLSFRLLYRAIRPRPHVDARRVLIFGAGDGGELLAREMFNNPKLRRVPVGFADDDPLKQGRVIHGLRVLGGHESLLEICSTYRVDEVIISTGKVPEGRVRSLVGDCQALAIALHRLRIEFERVGEPSDAVDAPQEIGPALALG